MYIDHFVVTCEDLESTKKEFEKKTGAKIYYGGEHPSLGTHNALLPLDNGLYIEFLAPKEERAKSNIFNLNSTKQNGYCLSAFCVSNIEKYLLLTDFSDSVKKAKMSRITKDNEEISWFIALDKQIDETFNGFIPFAIEWISPHPTSLYTASCKLIRFEIHTNNEVIRDFNRNIKDVEIYTNPNNILLLNFSTPNGLLSISSELT